MKKTILKGFKKDGKFRPTGKKTKSALKKTDVKPRKRKDATSGQTSSTGLPDPTGQFSGQGSPNWRNANQSKQQSQSNKQSKQTPPPQGTSPTAMGSLGSVAMPQSAGGKPTLPKGSGTLSKLGKGALGLLKGEAERQKKINEKKEKVKHDQEQIHDIINQSIDQILDDRNSTNEQKFRLLQRYAVENREAISEYQLRFINTSLKTLETEVNNPQTYIGAVQPIQKNAGRYSSYNTNKDKNKTSTTTSNTQQSGQRTSSTRDSNGNTIYGTSSTISGTGTTKEGDPDNLGAELSAIIG